MKRRKKQVSQPKADPGYIQAVEVRIRRYGVDAKTARSQEVGHGLGRLILALQRSGRIDRHNASIILGIAAQCEDIIHNYHTHVLGAPSPSPRSIDLNKVDHGQNDAELPEEVLKGIRRRYDRVRASITDLASWKVLERYCIGDNDLERWPVADIRRLLGALDSVRDA